MSKLAQAESAYERGDLDQAEILAAQAMNESRDAETLAAFCRIVGENGRRPDAAGLLAAVVDQYPNDGYLRTLLGEQQVRLGQWGPGVQNFVRGLNAASNQAAIQHSMMVVADLVAAHKSGKVKAEDANQFVNGILYNVARAPEELKSFLASARRAVNERSTLQEVGASVPPDNILVPGRIHRGPPQTPPPRPQSRSNARSAQAQERIDSSPMQRQRREAVGTGITMDRRSGGIKIAELIRRDIELNEQIQGTLEPMGLPMWPSTSTAEPLDNIPAMRPKMLGLTRKDMQGDGVLEFTEGSIASEILMERCWQSLREAAATGTARPLTLRPAEVTKLEVALWDGAAARMREVPAIFDDDPEYNPVELAVGKFIGDIICKNFGGFWYYERSPSRSFVQIRSNRVDTLALAREWFEARDKDDVSLERAVADARRSSGQQEHQEALIDVVTGLDDRALALKLAEQWVLFRSHPSDVQLVRVADAIRPEQKFGQMVVFSIDKAFTVGATPLGTTDKGRVSIAYDRRTDEFFILSSRKHFALFLSKADVKLSRDGLQEIANLFDSYHCPAVRVIRDGKDEDGPKFEDVRDGADFYLSARGGNRVVKWKIQYRENAPIRWNIGFAQ